MDVNELIVDGKIIVIVDTNCLIYAVENKLDLFGSISDSMLGKGEYQIFSPSTVVNELRSMAGKKGKNATTALVALSLFSTHNIKPIKTNVKADVWIKQISKQLRDLNRNCYVCTYDKALKKNLKELGVVIVSIKR